MQAGNGGGLEELERLTETMWVYRVTEPAALLRFGTQVRAALRDVIESAQTPEIELEEAVRDVLDHVDPEIVAALWIVVDGTKLLGLLSARILRLRDHGHASFTWAWSASPAAGAPRPFRPGLKMRAAFAHAERWARAEGAESITITRRADPETFGRYLSAYGFHADSVTFRKWLRAPGPQEG